MAKTVNFVSYLLLTTHAQGLAFPSGLTAELKISFLKEKTPMRMGFFPPYRLGVLGGTDKPDRCKENQRNSRPSFLVFFNNPQDVKDTFYLTVLTDMAKQKIAPAFSHCFPV